MILIHLLGGRISVFAMPIVPFVLDEVLAVHSLCHQILFNISVNWILSIHLANLLSPKENSHCAVVFANNKVIHISM